MKTEIKKYSSYEYITLRFKDDYNQTYRFSGRRYPFSF